MYRQIVGPEWGTLSLMLACYALWFGAGFFWTASWGILVIPVLATMSAFHTSLQHETIHGHPTKWGWLNELLVSLPLAGIFPYRRYRDLHLKHHNDLNLTDPYEDPESYFWPIGDFKRMRPIMRALFRFNNTLAGRILVGPALAIIGFLRTERCRISNNEPGVRLAWLLHLPGMVLLYFIVTQMFSMPFWVYFLGVMYPALAITSVRSYAEHQAAENVGARTAIVEACPALSLLYLNNNLHIVHHASPHIPWYDIPKLYRERKAHYLAANDHTLFDGYSEIFRRFAFKVKQPVDHPYMYRDEESSVS